MNVVEYLGLLVPMIALFGFLYKELKEWRAETREEIDGIRKEMQQQAQRSDRLYEMFIGLLKSDLLKSDPKTDP